MDRKDQEFIEAYLQKEGGVKSRVRLLSVTGMISTPSHNAVMVGVGHDVKEGLEFRGDRWSWNTTAGKPLHMADPGSILTGGALGRLLDCNPDPTPSFVLPDGNFVPEERSFKCRHNRVVVSATTETAQVNAIDMPIAGMVDGAFREIDKRMAHMSLEDAQRLLDTDKVTMITVMLKDPETASDFAEKMSSAANAKGLNLDILPWYKHTVAAYVLGGIDVLHVFRNLFMLIVVAIGVISVANTMMKSVNERTREIGTLRSLGFLQSQLVFIFSMEGLFLALLACLVGLGMTLVVTFLVGQLGLTYKAGILSIPIQLRIMLAPVAWTISAFVLTVLATGTAWICSRRASAMVIADAMRHV